MKYSHNYYNPELKHFARELRTDSVSKAEKFMWKSLLSRKQTGERFLRQRSIHNFIVDFFAPEIGLIIEIDGSSHINKGSYDECRDKKLKSLGFSILRFSEGQVLNDLDNVNDAIRHTIHCLKPLND